LPTCSKAHVRDVEDAIGRDVAAGIVHLVEHLFLARHHVETPTRTLHFAQDEATIDGDVGKREADPGHLGHILLARIRETAPGELGRALHHVTGDGAHGEPRVVVVTPIQPVHHAGEEQGRIRYAASHHHRGSGVQSGTHDVGSEIRVGGRHTRENGLHRLAALQQGQLRICPNLLADVIAEHDGHREVSQTQRLRFAAHCPGRCHRIGRPHIGHDSHPLTNARREHRLKAFREIRGVAFVGILETGEILSCNGTLGQALECQIVDPSLLGHLLRRIDPVVGKTRAAADTYARLLHRSALSMASAWHAR
jgi:hypothetical protein